MSYLVYGTPYNLGDGPSGGWIYLISGNIYYEAAPNDLGTSVWSNVNNALIGTTSGLVGS